MGTDISGRCVKKFSKIATVQVCAHRMDLTGDGKDEAVFLMAGYDHGGYALFYDEFQKVAVVWWNYL